MVIYIAMVSLLVSTPGAAHDESCAPGDCNAEALDEMSLLQAVANLKTMSEMERELLEAHETITQLREQLETERKTKAETEQELFEVREATAHTKSNRQPEAYGYVGSDWCQDDQGKTTSSYLIYGPYACQAQCDSDPHCVAYSSYTNPSCVVYAPGTSAAPAGWELKLGSGAVDITVGTDARRVGSSSFACMKKHATFTLLGDGACRTADGGGGQYTKAQSSSLSDCKSKCEESTVCVAVEWIKSGKHCELHTASITHAAINGKAQCWKKLGSAP
jgi:hypothetical protein